MISNISLLVFLALSMMTMKLWKLIDLALPMLVILIAQMVLMTLFGIFVTFRVMGKNFDAAVMTVGAGWLWAWVQFLLPWQICKSSTPSTAPPWMGSMPVERTALMALSS